MTIKVTGQNVSIGCFVAGECVEGLVSGVSVVDTVGECVDFCTESDGCQYFTYAMEDNICLALDECPDLSTSNCGSCISIGGCILSK